MSEAQRDYPHLLHPETTYFPWGLGRGALEQHASEVSAAFDEKFEDSPEDAIPRIGVIVQAQLPEFEAVPDDVIAGLVRGVVDDVRAQDYPDNRVGPVLVVTNQNRGMRQLGRLAGNGVEIFQPDPKKTQPQVLNEAATRLAETDLLRIGELGRLATNQAFRAAALYVDGRDTVGAFGTRLTGPGARWSEDLFYTSAAMLPLSPYGLRRVVKTPKPKAGFMAMDRAVVARRAFLEHPLSLDYSRGSDGHWGQRMQEKYGPTAIGYLPTLSVHQPDPARRPLRDQMREWAQRGKPN